MIRGQDREGFALPLTIFILAVLTVMLTAGLLRVAADRRIADASGSMANSRMIAQSGLQYYLGTRTKRPEYDTANWTSTHDGDSLRINVTGGYALVVARQVQRPADTSANETYIVQSTGYYVVPALGSDPQARRTVAQFAVWQTASLDSLTGAVTLVDGASKTGAVAGGLSGTDACAALPAKAGVTLSNGKTLSGTTTNQSIGNAAAVYTATGITWSADTNKTNLSPDYNDVAPNYGDNNYSVYLYHGNLTIPKNSIGTGLLIVTGDLTFLNQNSNFTSYRGWNGVILVGGKISFGNDSVHLYGQVIAGLNKSNSPTDLTTGSYDIKYSSCEVKKALASFGGMHPISNAWIDNWAGW